MTGIVQRIFSINWDEWRGSLDGRPTFRSKTLLHFRGRKVCLHKFIAADDPDCFHTHPAHAVRIILAGGYVEELESGDRKAWRPGYIGKVPPTMSHRAARLINGKWSYSIWLRGPIVAKIELRGTGWDKQRAAETDTYQPPEHGWTCFHCGETFTNAYRARDHFGADPSATPGCLLKVEHGEERGLLMAFRRLELANERLRRDIEDETTSTKLFYARLKSELRAFNPFRECRSVQDVFNLYDSMEGRALAAEAILKAIEKFSPDDVCYARDRVCNPEKAAAADKQALKEMHDDLVKGDIDG